MKEFDGIPELNLIPTDTQLYGLVAPIFDSFLI